MYFRARTRECQRVVLAAGVATVLSMCLSALLISAQCSTRKLTALDRHEGVPFTWTADNSDSDIFQAIWGRQPPD
eukprot:3463231-Rhodomonas_salina.1